MMMMTICLLITKLHYERDNVKSNKAILTPIGASGGPWARSDQMGIKRSKNSHTKSNIHSEAGRGIIL